MLMVQQIYISFSPKTLRLMSDQLMINRQLENSKCSLLSLSQIDEVSRQDGSSQYSQNFSFLKKSSSPKKRQPFPISSLSEIRLTESPQFFDNDKDRKKGLHISFIQESGFKYGSFSREKTIHEENEESISEYHLTENGLKRSADTLSILSNSSLQKNDGKFKKQIPKIVYGEYFCSQNQINKKEEPNCCIPATCVPNDRSKSNFYY